MTFNEAINEEIHDWVRDYNWDDGLAQIWPIVENEQTDFATALLIYWRLEGPWFARHNGTETAKLHSLVESRLRAGRYPKGSLRYDPIADNQISQTRVARLKKEGFPIDLLEPEYDSQG